MRWLAVVLGLWAVPAAAVTCEDIQHDGLRYTICTVDATTEHLRLFHKDPVGDVIGSLRALIDLPGVTAVPFAMNAGMYHSDRSPVGHYVENGVETMRVIPNAGPGNFGLLPNGVFCISEDAVRIFETLAYIAEAPSCRDATQSGPMLVINGEMHPRFLSDSTSRFIRNGVGVTADGKQAIFAISNDAVSFYEFGSLFRDYLAVPDALFFDGKVSRLHAPSLGRSDIGFQLGPMVAVIE